MYKLKNVIYFVPQKNLFVYLLNINNGRIFKIDVKFLEDLNLLSEGCFKKDISDELLIFLNKENLIYEC